MNKSFKEGIYIVVIIAVFFALSFCEINGFYFFVTIPLLMALLSIKSLYFAFGCLAMIFASFFVEKSVFPAILISSFSVSYLMNNVLNKFNIPLKIQLSILGAFLAITISWTSSLSIWATPVINVFISAGLIYLLSYCAVDIAISLKSKEEFSLTKNQLVFLSFLFSVIVFNLGIVVNTFDLNFVLVVLFNYLIMRVDPIAGMLSYFVCVLFNTQVTDSVTMLFMFIPLILSLRSLYKTRHFGALIYAGLNILFILYFKNMSLFLEVAFISTMIAIIPEKFVNFINKFIIEPQDYELKLYQQSYYKCINRNKKIQKVMLTLEEQIQNNSKMKKSNKEIFVQDMQFLSDKLKEEDNIHFKSKILNDLEVKGNDVVALRIGCDYLNNYKIFLQIRSRDENVESIINVLEEYLKVKIKLKSSYYNFMIRAYNYVFVNDDIHAFNFHIRQRSKDESSCGDSYLTFETKNKKYFLISDGMGHGKNASKNSSAAILLLKNFIELGMDAGKAIVSCNALIYDKDNEKFNTLDLLEYDSFEDKVFLYKNGSGVTYVKKEEKIEKIISENLPLGIIENIKVEKLTLDLEPGYIVLTSDGIRKDLGELLKASTAKNSKTLANEILEYEGQNIEDDQTIVVINVIKKS